ncbi:MacS family sensor histidine kinase [Nocardioides sp. GXQ0305]|uniref:MacS family sensor histidine kinase n=1 Tax=Nocardioides sp. GXQ0305 TaxID=3423912 RepID=UPI003D7D3B94
MTLRRIRLWSHPALAVEDRLFRALAILRVVVLVNALALNLYRADNFRHPALGVLACAVMLGWTVFVTVQYADPARRTTPLLVADLAVAVGLVLVSPLIKGEGLQATIPGFWVMGALLAWAIHWHWRGGLVAGVVLAAADLSVRQDVGQGDYGNVFLLVIGGPIVGFMAESLQLMARERDAAQREAIAGEERARLARAVHDGVLQVLSLVQRRGAELEPLSPDFAELGRLAGEQESALRSLIRQQDVQEATGETDVAAALEELSRAVRLPVTVSTPGMPVVLPGAVVAELVAAVRACLDNVATHVGPDAPAWVLLEDAGDSVVVTVRDEGPGIPSHRLLEAAQQGRLGVSQSIEARVRELGGTAALDTSPHGTEWELTVPRLAG